MTFFEMLLVVLILLGVGIFLTGKTDQIDNNDLISKCEEPLPRTQRCVLIAVPELEGK